MECELLSMCGFFKRYCATNNMACQGLINRYCKGDDQKNCKRLEYRKNYGTPPPDNMMPSGLIIKEA